MKLDWVIWVLVGIWILAPPFVVFIMTGIALVVMVAVGTHLEIIAVHLTQKVMQLWKWASPLGMKSISETAWTVQDRS